MIFPIIFYHYYLDSPRVIKDFGYRINKAGVFIKNGKRNDFFYPKNAVFKIQKNVLEKIIEKPDYIDYVLEKFKKDGKKFLAFIKIKDKLNLSKVDNEKLFKIYQEYNKFFTELNYPVLILIAFSVIDKLGEKIKEKVTNLDDLNSLIKSDKLPYLLEYELDILSSKKQDASKLYNKWYWVPFDYYGANKWTMDDFKKELIKPKDKERAKYLKNYKKNNQRNTQEIINKYNLNEEEVRIIKFIKLLNYLQDERKKVTNISYPFLQEKIIKEFTKRTDIKSEILWLMTPQEIRDALKGRKYNLEERKESCAIEIHNGKFIVHEKIPSYLKTSQDIKNRKMIKGMPASKGVVSGKVKICKTSKEIEKMKKGQVLVAPTTSPDYIMGFKKAIAVVTDEGGLTCHAAVVSREMRLPCVINTKFASEILKDGDLVEVDAERGTVKIIKKAK